MQAKGGWSVIGCPWADVFWCWVIWERLARDGGRLRRLWGQLGRRLRLAGCQPVALLPCSPTQCDPVLRSLYQLVSWEHPVPPRLNDDQQRHSIDRLLQLLSPTVRFSPGLLRAVRMALGAVAPPASIESLLWQDEATQDLNLTVSALDREEAKNRLVGLPPRMMR